MLCPRWYEGALWLCTAWAMSYRKRFVWAKSRYEVLAAVPITPGSSAGLPSVLDGLESPVLATTTVPWCIAFSRIAVSGCSAALVGSPPNPIEMDRMSAWSCWIAQSIPCRITLVKLELLLPKTFITSTSAPGATPSTLTAQVPPVVAKSGLISWSRL